MARLSWFLQNTTCDVFRWCDSLTELKVEVRWRTTHSPVAVCLWLKVKSDLERASKPQIYDALWMWVMASVTFLPSPMIAMFPGTGNTTFFLSSSLAYFWGSAPILTTLRKNWTRRAVVFGTSLVPALRLMVSPGDPLDHSLSTTSCTLEPRLQLRALPCFPSCEMSY